MSAPAPRWFGMTLALSALLLVATRLAALDPVATTGHHWRWIRRDQFGFGDWLCSHGGSGPLTFRALLPESIDMHGVVLLNSLLAAPVSCVLGASPATASVLAAGWSAAALVLWASALRRLFGARPALIFILFWLAPPPPLFATTAFLMGSHVEGMALAGLVLHLSFRRSQQQHVRLFLAAGPLLFLYKPLVVLLPLSLAFAGRRLEPSMRLSALRALLLGFAPWAVLALVFGVGGWQLIDGHPEVTWLNFMHCPGGDLPALAVRVGGQLSNGLPRLFPALCAACACIVFSVALRRGDRTRRMAAVWLVLTPMLYLGVLDLSCHAYLSERYLLLLHPLGFALVAVALGRVPRGIGLLAAVGVLGALWWGSPLRFDVLFE